MAIRLVVLATAAALLAGCTQPGASSGLSAFGAPAAKDRALDQTLRTKQPHAESGSSLMPLSEPAVRERLADLGYGNVTSLHQGPHGRLDRQGDAERQATAGDRHSGRRDRRALAVEPQQVVPRQTESADGRLRVQATMWPMPVIAMEPLWQLRGS